MARPIRLCPLGRGRLPGRSWARAQAGYRELLYGTGTRPQENGASFDLIVLTAGLDNRFIEDILSLSFQ